MNSVAPVHSSLPPSVNASNGVSCNQAVGEIIRKLWGVRGIYQIQNLKTLKVYVGSSKNIGKRIQFHFSQLRRGKHDSPKLQHSFVKHSEAAFTVALLERCDTITDAELTAREQVWMDNLNAYKGGYNSRPTSDCSRGVIKTPDIIERTKASVARFWKSNEGKNTAKALSKQFKGKQRGVWTEESSKKSSQSLKHYYSNNPFARLDRSAISLSSAPKCSDKKKAGMAKHFLKNPDDKQRRAAQMHQHRAKAHITILLNAFSYHSKQLSPLGILTPLQLAEHCVRRFSRGESARSISLSLGIDHKCVMVWMRALPKLYKAKTPQPL